jgi:orotate phosphoribosyltransferase/AMMECR1 domain-containing protein
MRSDSVHLAKLRDLLASDGILQATTAEPVLGRDGSRAPWMFYSWNVTLTAEGLRLAASCLLERLASFRSTQLAAHGMTGLPLLSACVEMGEGKYTGAAIRQQRKAYLSRRLVEGPLDPSRSIVVVDDSLSSGTALRSAIAALEAEGCVVEGAVVLVNFPGRGGLEGALDNGYRVESLFDIDRDLGQPLHSRSRPLHSLAPATDQPLPDGLAPAVLARRAAGIVLTTRTRPVAPSRLDRDYDGSGGVFVSFRRRSDDYRVAREGIWHFDGEVSRPAADVIDATVATVRAAGASIRAQDLDALKIGVTFLGPMEPIEPSQLDFDRYAIVVRDMAGRRAGGALPNTQVFTSEVEQYAHAWQRNARIGPTEAHRLYRQTVDKATEPGASWPVYGAPAPAALSWVSDPEVGRRLTGWARGLLRGSTPSDLSDDDLIASPIDGISVALYRRGTLATSIAWGPGPVAARIREAVADLRQRVSPSVLAAADLAIMVGVLYEPERLVGNGTELAAKKIRKGLDTVRVDSGGQHATMLPGALVYNGWSKEQLVGKLLELVPKRPSRFTTYQTALWLDDGGRCWQVRSGFPVPGRDDRGVPEEDIRSLAGFLERNLDPRGIPVYRLDIVSGARTWQGTAPRQLHALMGLDRAGRLLGERHWRQAARQGFERYVADTERRPGGFAVSTGGSLADAILVAAVGSATDPLANHPAVAAARDRLRSSVDPFGRITVQRVRIGRAQDFEYLPGAVLVALAADPAVLDGVPASRLARALAWHRERIRVLHSWGEAGWQMQAWSAIWRHHRSDDQAAFVFEMADWAIERQLDKNGAFLENLSPSEPSFNTGFIAEGIAAAWALAEVLGDADRARRYEASWSAANGFMRSLLVAKADTFVCRDPVVALGGVRLTPSVPYVRADSVSHWLNALVTGATLQTTKM